LNAKVAKITKEEMDQEIKIKTTIRRCPLFAASKAQSHEWCGLDRHAARKERFASFAIFALNSSSAPSA
jgi:hypothetical protein